MWMHGNIPTLKRWKEAGIETVGMLDLSIPYSITSVGAAAKHKAWICGTTMTVIKNPLFIKSYLNSGPATAVVATATERNARRIKG